MDWKIAELRSTFSLTDGKINMKCLVRWWWDSKKL